MAFHPDLCYLNLIYENIPLASLLWHLKLGWRHAHERQTWWLFDHCVLPAHSYNKVWGRYHSWGWPSFEAIRNKYCAMIFWCLAYCSLVLDYFSYKRVTIITEINIVKQYSGWNTIKTHCGTWLPIINSSKRCRPDATVLVWQTLSLTAQYWNTHQDP